MHHGWPPPQLGRTVRGTTVCALAVAALLTAAGCSTYDESAGTFTLTATGGLQVATHGSARAYHSAPLSSVASEYLIALDLDSASPPLRGFSALVIVTEERPIGNGRFIDSSTRPTRLSNTLTTASVGLQVPSGAVSEWDTDSATVDFKAVRGRHAVAGDFELYVNCDHCDPPKKGLHAVLHGSFETHD